MNRPVLVFFMVLCLWSASSFSALAFETKSARTVIGTVYIRADGRVEGTTTIQTADNVTYVLLGNMNDSIVVERDNIIINGEGYTVQGSESGKGFYWTGINNVTVRNTNIKGFNRGISIYSSSDNSISGNNITDNYIGIDLFYSSNNNISGNNIADNDSGFWLRSPNNSISGNNITRNKIIGIFLLDSSKNNSISGNNIANNGEGIALRNSYYESISGNNITNNGFGVWFDSAYYTSVSGNSIANNSIGILLDSQDFDPPSKNNNISGNNMANNGIGIDLGASSNNNSIIGNNFTASSSCGISLYSSSNTSIIGNTFTNDGLANFYSYQNFVDGNTVNGKPLVYLEDTSNYNVSDAGQVILVNCDGIRVENLNLSKASRGVQLLNTTNSIIARNNIANNFCGISLYSSTNNNISANNITDNDYYGVDFESSSNSNSISRNNIANNHYGIGFNSSSGNIVYQNNFRENIRQARSIGSTNVWDAGYPSGGNYWSDYNGTDANSDRIGDTPYIIYENNQDNYPLMNPSYIPPEELQLLYDDLQDKYNRLLGNYMMLLRDFNSLYANYTQHLQDYSSLQLNHTSVQQNLTQLQNNFTGLQQNYTALQTGQSDLQTRFNSLNLSYASIESSYQTLNSYYNSLNASFNEYKASIQSELAYAKNVEYTLTAIVVVLLVAMVYGVSRKPQTKTETKGPPQSTEMK